MWSIWIFTSIVDALIKIIQNIILYAYIISKITISKIKEIKRRTKSK